MTHTTVTAAEMKALEKAADDNGLLYIQMMENAGRAAFAQLRRRLPGPARLLADGIARMSCHSGGSVRSSAGGTLPGVLPKGRPGCSVAPEVPLRLPPVF